MIELLQARIGNPTGKRVTVLGLAFKPGTDDVRESPALPIIASLLGAGATVTAHDPIAIETGRRGLADFGADPAKVNFEPSLEAALKDSDAVMLVTSWPEYREAPALLSKLGSQAPLIDGRRFLPRDSVAVYSGIGLSV